VRSKPRTCALYLLVHLHLNLGSLKKTLEKVDYNCKNCFWVLLIWSGRAQNSFMGPIQTEKGIPSRPGMRPPEKGNQLGVPINHPQLYQEPPQNQHAGTHRDDLTTDEVESTPEPLGSPERHTNPNSEKTKLSGAYRPGPRHLTDQDPNTMVQGQISTANQ
jgi:hypothetical protein